MLAKLKRRSDFLTLQKNGCYIRSRSSSLQVCKVVVPEEIVRTEPEERALPLLIFVGFTTSRKVGHAVQRNRARRRLRAWTAQNLLSVVQNADFCDSKVQTVALSKATWQAFRGRQPRVAKMVGTKTQVLALVFIANRATPEISWNDLHYELCGAVKRGLRGVAKTPKGSVA